MTSVISHNLATSRDAPAAAQDLPRWPRWVEELVRGGQRRLMKERTSESSLTVIDAAEHRLVRARVTGAGSLSDEAFAAAAAGAYVQIVTELQSAPARHAVRFWNYIPDIHRVCSGGTDRYMVFNAGRFEACRHWQAADVLPTASGIGHGGNDLIIDALAMVEPGLPVENPRQRPSYVYSRRYGPRPPCFSRATLIPARGAEPPRLLVGGTASVVGEDSMHAGNLAAQIDETLRNLASLVAAAGGAAGNSRGLKALRRFTELRIYRPRAGDDKQIDQTVAAHFPQSRTEYVSADLCRKELLIEIEGVAILKGLR